MSDYGKMRNPKGQSTIEYLIVVAAVIAALLIFARGGGIFQSKMNETYDMGMNAMLNMAERVFQ